MRVKAILRRSSGAKASVVTEKIPFADLILDTESRSCFQTGGNDSADLYGVSDSGASCDA